MLRLTVRSSLVLIGSAVAGSLLVFLLLRLLGGDIATVILGKSATPEALATLREELNLNQSWMNQYVDWIAGLARGDLGDSYAVGYDIFDQIRSRLPITFVLAVSSLAVSSLLALVAGTYSAINSKKARGVAVDIIAQIGVALPIFWAGLLLVSLFSVRLGWLPAGGAVGWTESPGSAVRVLLLPVLAISMAMGAILTRFVRSSMIEVLNEDYIRTAIAKGRTPTTAAIVHGVRNAAIPLVTVAILNFGAILAGSVVVETVFSLPGLGRMLLDAVGNREAVVVQSLVFVILLMILALNFVMDLLYGLLDPRVRDAGRGRD